MDRRHDSTLPSVLAGTRLPPLFGVVVRPIQRFFRLEAASGVLLFGAALVALLWANLSAESYQRTFDLVIDVSAMGNQFSFTLREVINDGLMTLFFFVVGMEIKRELVLGGLRTVGRALLPGIAALGGMLVPALVYLAFNPRGPERAGWGIPIATDIAFCIGLLTLLKSRVAQALVVFITALAIFDDIGGILVIALFYGHGLSIGWLMAAGIIAAATFAAGRLETTSGSLFALAGAALWYALHRSGIHATIAGVVLGLAIPSRARRRPREVLGELSEHVSVLLTRPANEEIEDAEILMIDEKLHNLGSPLCRYVQALHPLVAFGVMPAFALANSGISLRSMSLSDLTGGITLGIALGLLFGKQLGIFTFTFVATRLGVAPIPGGSSLGKLFGVSTIAGIGFTVSIFIAGLAFQHAPHLLAQAKLGILAGSIIAGVVGAAILHRTARLRPALREAFP